MKSTRKLKYFALLTSTSAMVWSAATYAVAPTNDSAQKPAIEVHLEALNQLQPAAITPSSGQQMPVPFEVKSKSEYQTAPIANMVNRDSTAAPTNAPTPILPLEAAPPASTPQAMQMTPTIPPAPRHPMDYPAEPPRVTALPAPIPPKNMQARPPVVHNQGLPRHEATPILPPNAPPALPYRASPTLEYQAPSSKQDSWWNETTNFVGGLFGADDAPQAQAATATSLQPQTLPQPAMQPTSLPTATKLPTAPATDIQTPPTIAPAPLAPSGLAETTPAAPIMEPAELAQPLNPVEPIKPIQPVEPAYMQAEPADPTMSAATEAPAVPITIPLYPSPVQENVATYDGYELAEGLAGAPDSFDTAPDLSFAEPMTPPPSQTAAEPTLPQPTYDGSETLLGQIGQDSGEPVEVITADASASPAMLIPPPAVDTAEPLESTPTAPLPTAPVAEVTPEIIAKPAPDPQASASLPQNTKGSAKEDSSWFKGLKNDLEGYFAEEEKAQEQSKLAAEQTPVIPETEASTDQTVNLATPEPSTSAAPGLPSLPGISAGEATAKTAQTADAIAQAPAQKTVKITKLDPTIKIKADMEAKAAAEAKADQEAEAKKAAAISKAAQEEAKSKQLTEAKAAAEAEKAAKAEQSALMEQAKKDEQLAAAKAAQEAKATSEAKAAKEAELAAAAKAQEAKKMAEAKKAAEAAQEAQQLAAKKAEQEAKAVAQKQAQAEQEAQAAKAAQEEKQAEAANAAKQQAELEAQKTKEEAQTAEAKTLIIPPKSEQVDLQRDEQAAAEIAQEVEAPVQLASLPDKKTMAEATASATSTLSFDGSATDLAPGSESQLNQLATELKKSESTRLAIRAYAAAEEGQEVLARRIALARGLAVRAYLIEQGVNALRINVQSVGNDQGINTKNEVELELKKVGGA